jgi:hypothetical protein
VIAKGVKIFAFLVSLQLLFVPSVIADWTEFQNSDLDTSNGKLLSKAYDVERISFAISDSNPSLYNFFLHFANPVSNALFADRTSFAAILIDIDNDGDEDYSIDTNYDQVYKTTQLHDARLVDRRNSSLDLVSGCKAQTWTDLDRKVSWIGFRVEKSCIPFGTNFSLWGYADFKSGDNTDFDLAPDEWWTVTPGLAANKISRACIKQDFETLFSSSFYPGWSWATVEGPVGKNPATIAGERTSRSFTQDQKSWLRSAFNSWDVASEALSFTEVDVLNNPKILLGIVDSGYRWQIYGITADGPLSEAWIKFDGKDSRLSEKEKFISLAQSYIGNILNLGYIRATTEIESVLESPLQSSLGKLVLSDFDIALIRQLNGESTCEGSWSPELTIAVSENRKTEAKAKAETEAKAKAETEAKAKAEAEAKAKAEAEAKAKAEAEAKAKAEAEAKAKAEAEAKAKAETEAKAKVEAEAKAEIVRKAKKTITCVKGKTSKKITALKPKCPPGYTKK